VRVGHLTMSSCNRLSLCLLRQDRRSLHLLFSCAVLLDTVAVTDIDIYVASCIMGKTCDSVVETANVTDHAHERVSCGRPRQRLETVEARVYLTVQRDRGRRAGTDETAEQAATRRAADREYIAVTVAQTLLHYQGKMQKKLQTRSDVVKKVVNVQQLNITKHR